MSPVVPFLLGSLAAMAVVVAGLFFALRSVTIKEAERNTRERVRIEGALVEAAGLSDGVLKRDPNALAKLDGLVQAQVMSDSVVRVKLWSRNGTILYSDEPALIGRRYALGDEEQDLFETGAPDTELSPTSKPEN